MPAPVYCLGCIVWDTVLPALAAPNTKHCVAHMHFLCCHACSCELFGMYCLGHCLASIGSAKHKTLHRTHALSVLSCLLLCIVWDVFLGHCLASIGSAKHKTLHCTHALSVLSCLLLCDVWDAILPALAAQNTKCCSRACSQCCHACSCVLNKQVLQQTCACTVA